MAEADAVRGVRDERVAPDVALMVADDDHQGRHLPLSALLLRADTSLSSVLGAIEPRELTCFRVEVDGVLSLAPNGLDDESQVQIVIRRRNTSPPDWKAFLLRAELPLTVTDAEQESVLVAIRVDVGGITRTILWCFGQISRSVPRSHTDNRFGLIVALNKHAAGENLASWRRLPPEAPRRRVIGDPTARVRGTVHQVRDGYPHRATSRSAGPAPIDGLRFDDMSDLLRTLSLRTQDELMSDLEGGRSLRFTTYVESLTDLTTLAEHLVMIRYRNDYQAEWDWIDRFVPVEDEAEIDEVLHELFDRLVGTEEFRVDLLMPTMPDTEDTVARVIRYGWPGNRGLVGQALTMDVLRVWLRRHNDDVGPQLLRRKMRFALEGHENEIAEIPLLDLLVAELMVDDQDYVLSDGEVLRVDANFLHTLDTRLEAQLPWTDFPFPTFEGGTEPDYLATAGRRSNDRLLLLDDDPIRLPGEHPFEVCDLLSDDRRLIFAKLKGRSSLFSHLAVQVETSAEMLLRSAEARGKFLASVNSLTADPRMIKAADDIVTLLERRHPDQITITLLLLGSWKRKSVTSLPLVSRLRLRRTAQRVAALGYRLEIAGPDQHSGHLTPRPRAVP